MREIFVVRASGERIIFREFDGSRGGSRRRDSGASASVSADADGGPRGSRGVPRVPGGPEGLTLLAIICEFTVALRFRIHAEQR